MTSRFSELLRQLRLRGGMTQEQLEEHSGVSVRTIRRLETADHANAGVATVKRLADALRLSPEERDGLLAAAIGVPAATAPVPRHRASSSAGKANWPRWTRPWARCRRPRPGRRPLPAGPGPVRDLGYTYEAAGTLERLGHPHLALGQHDEAVAVWEEALAIYQSQQRTADAQRVQDIVDSLPHR
ncbi:helix-turn-helix transcriptional regulator [Lentzea sp. NPDC005914]|uniref:helix-turn-helix transcriptional regulator n=1 Tax=Lentzea sp. NPDC005914 TaxID=3154572 RepID=UPI0033BFDF33